MKQILELRVNGDRHEVGVPTHFTLLETLRYVLGLTALPWSLKFINGFIMDRYTILSMGRRRAWVIGAQMLMILVFLSAAIVQPAADDVLLLGIFGLLGNAATTFQDVAADGRAGYLVE